MSGPHEEGQRQSALSGRVAAVIVLLFAAILAVAASGIEYAFSSDPLGPQAFPYLLAAAFALCGVWYFRSPGAADPWPQLETLRRAFGLIAVTAAAIAVMDFIGFLPVAFIVCAWAAYLFGAPPRGALLIGAAQAVFWFGLFKYALGTYLPAGTLFFPN